MGHQHIIGHSLSSSTVSNINTLPWQQWIS